MGDADQDAKPESGERPSRQSQLFFLLLLVAVGLVIWHIFQPFVLFMIAGTLLAVIALPLDKLWERILPQRLAAIGAMLTLFVIIMVPLVALGFALVGEAQNFAQAMDEGKIRTAIDDAMAAILPDQSAEQRNATIASAWDEAKPRVQATVANFLTGAVGWVADLLMGVVIILFVVYYVFTDGHRLVAWLRRVAPLPPAQVDRLLREANGGVKAVFFGQIVTSLIQGALGGIGFLIAGLPGVVLWASIMAVLSLLPVVGAFLIWVPAAVYLLATGHIWQGIFLLIWGGLVVSQVDNFVRPKLIGDRADIHPLFVLIGVLGGVAAFGFIGLFLGPLMVGIIVSLLKVWETDYLEPTLREEG